MNDDDAPMIPTDLHSMAREVAEVYRDVVGLIPTEMAAEAGRVVARALEAVEHARRLGAGPEHPVTRVAAQDLAAAMATLAVMRPAER